MDLNDETVLEVNEIGVVKFVFRKKQCLMEGSCCEIGDQLHYALGLDQGHKVVSTLEGFHHLAAFPWIITYVVE